VFDSASKVRELSLTETATVLKQRKLGQTFIIEFLFEKLTGFCPV
jgi:hypothetical protein